MFSNLSNRLNRGECRRVTPLLWDHALGRLRGPERERVEEHLRSCAGCRAEAAAFARTAGMVAADREEALPAPAPAWSDIEGVLKHDLRARRSLVVDWRAWPLAAGGAAAAALLLALLFRPAPPHPVQEAKAGQQPNAGTLAQVDNLRGPRNRSGAAGHAPGASAPPRTGGGAPVMAAAGGPQSAGPRLAQHDPAPIANRLPAPAPRLKPNGSSPTMVADMAYINGKDAAATMAGWRQIPADRIAALQARIDRELRTGDDFVRVPFPRLASQDPRSLAAAASAYRTERAIVDARLTRHVTLGVKALAFSDLCRQLSEQTGIEIGAGRSVADDKVTLFCDDQPLRDVMRQINHVFGFVWGRSGQEQSDDSGKPGAYRYELTQDLRSQLLEEEMRSQDLHAALLDIDARMRNEPPKPGSLESLAATVYHALSPADLAALRAGQTVTFNGWSNDPAHRLPDDLNKSVVHTFPRIETDKGAMNEWPGINGQITLRVDRSEVGQLSLVANIGIHQVEPNGYVGQGVTGDHVLAVGQSPTVSQPDNRHRNESLRPSSVFEKLVSLHPRHHCPADDQSSSSSGAAEDTYPNHGAESEARIDRYARGVRGQAHVWSADVWEEVHRETGLPIVADSFMRLYPADRVTMERVPLFEALNRLGDAMRVRWRMEDGFLQARSTSFVWDRLKEVPNRLLERWHADSKANQGLPLRDFLQMANLTDEQLDSVVVGDVMVECWGLKERDLLQNTAGGYSPRSFARVLADMSAAERAQLFRPEGATVSGLAQAHRQRLFAIFLKDRPYLTDELDQVAAQFGSWRFRIDYVPSGRYVWEPYLPPDQQMSAFRQPVASGTTAESALTEARKQDPNAASSDIVRSSGAFAVTQLNAQGQAFVVEGFRPVRLFR